MSIMWSITISPVPSIRYVCDPFFHFIRKHLFRWWLTNWFHSTVYTVRTQMWTGWKERSSTWRSLPVSANRLQLFHTRIFCHGRFRSRPVEGFSCMGRSKLDSADRRDWVIIQQIKQRWTEEKEKGKQVNRYRGKNGGN